VKNTPCILIGRPEPAASRLAARVRAAGLDPLLAPAFRLAGPASPRETATRLRSLLPVNWIVLPSPAAVTHTLQLVDIGALRSCRVLVPGPGTARVARDSGLDRIHAPARDFTTEAMLELEALQHVSGQKVLICAASGGRQTLGRRLARRGAQVERLEVYRRIPLDLPEPIRTRLPGCHRLVIVASSGAILARLVGNLEQVEGTPAARALWLVPSPRVQVQAKELGLKRIQVVPGMDHEAVVEAAAQVR